MKYKWVLWLLLAAVLAGCASPAEPAEEGKLLVFATLFPQYDFARVIGGEEADVRMLLPAGVEPHHFEPTPKDLTDLAKADLLLYTGDIMEPWAKRVVQSAPELQLIDVSRGVTLLNTLEEHDHEEHDHEEHDHEEHEGADPHIWTDLSNARIMAKNVLEALKTAAPEHAELFTSRWEAYDQELKALDEAYLTTLSALPNKTLLYGGHFAFGYLAQRYGLEHRSPYAGYSGDAEPTPADMARLIDALKATGAHTLFYEELTDPRIAQSIAEETGTELVLLHAAHNLGSEEWQEGKTFLSIMRENLDKLSKGLR